MESFLLTYSANPPINKNANHPETTKKFIPFGLGLRARSLVEYVPQRKITKFKVRK
jgi:hypothetical protein